MDEAELEACERACETGATISVDLVRKLTRCARQLIDMQMQEAANDMVDPAYYRGHDSGVFGVLEIWQRVLDGKDEGHGVMGHPDIEQCRRITMDLLERSARLAGLEE